MIEHKTIIPPYDLLVSVKLVAETMKEQSNLEALSDMLKNDFTFNEMVEILLQEKERRQKS
jgi:hypothetical protein